ncbi:MAG: aminoacetone oxidase family FAD-binding enzyme [Verrucomicrobiota bacterium]|jgi:predicted flavoprotein YhiN|nr:aminoacetone oxidase family FAD-binding enzyme [Verrucomicrobiota bacterium]
MTVDTLIIGGGPAGLTAACFSAGPALVVEHQKAPARKLLATGGGRCNLTHDTDADGIIAAFGRQGRFMSPALNAFPPAAVRAFFAGLGVETRAEPDGCVFPVSQKAADVAQALERAARAAGAEIRCGVRAERLVVSPDGDLTAVQTSGGPIHARRVILAAGGRSYPALGSDGSGFTLAREAGLAVTPPVPALAGLVTREPWPATLAGIVLDSAGLRLDAPGLPKTWLTGPVLFTHKGVSGLPAINLSGEISARLGARPAAARNPAARNPCHPAAHNPCSSAALSAEKAPPHASGDGAPELQHPGGQSPDVRLRLACVAGRSAADWRALFDGWRQRHGGRALHNLLSGELPRAVAAVLCGLAGAQNLAAARASKGVLDALAAACAEQPLHVTGTEGWERAMVTRGGVALSELDPKTLASRRVRGLFCAGEVVDLDGLCGGYNLTWAFASGRLAGMG